METKREKIRRKRGISQSELARMSGIRQGSISRIERGRRGMSLTTAAKLARAVDVTVDALAANLDDSTGRVAPARLPAAAKPS
jgi:transcriptional regulator with XRE-family HTH domain